MKSSRNFYKYILLGILGMVGTSSTIFADTFFVANRLGTSGLTTLNIAIAIFGLLSGTGLMLGVGGATMYSIYQAQKDSKKAKQIFTLAFLNSIIIGLILFCCGLFLAKPIAQMLGAKGEILSMCTSYIKTVLCFSPFFVINYLMMPFIRNDANPKLAMLMMVAGSLSNIVLDYLFLYPLNMGIFGAALATGFSPIISLIIGLFHFISYKNNLRLVKIRYSFKDTLEIIRPGLATLISEFSASLVLVVFNLIILHISNEIGVASYGVVANLGLIVIAIFNGLTQGLQPLFSVAYGENETKQLKHLLHKGLIISFLIGLAFHLLSIAFTSQLVSIFNSENNPLLEQWAKEGLVTYFVGYLFAGLNYLLISYFSIIGKTKLAFTLSIFRGFVGIIVLALILGNTVGLFGIWLTYPLVEFISLVLATLAYQREAKMLDGYLLEKEKRETA